jgi:hypothetical protein
VRACVCAGGVSHRRPQVKNAAFTHRKSKRQRARATAAEPDSSADFWAGGLRGPEPLSAGHAAARHGAQPYYERRNPNEVKKSGKRRRKKRR